MTNTTLSSNSGKVLLRHVRVPNSKALPFHRLARRDAATVCQPEPHTFKQQPMHITVMGQRFGVLYDTAPTNFVNENKTECCPSHFLPLPEGWSIAQNTEQARLAAKMFPFASSAVVFADGTAFVTVYSGLLNANEADYVISRGALLEKDNTYGVARDSLPSTRWGSNYAYCARVLVTQPGKPGDYEYLQPPSGWMISHYATFDGVDYASLDDMDPNMPWGSPGISSRQQQALAMPLGNWKIGTAAQAQSSHISPFGSGCLVVLDGNAYYTTTKQPCSEHALHGHTAANGVQYYWPSPALGALRILITRQSRPTPLNTKQMSTLILSPHSLETDAEKAKADLVLGYAKDIVSKFGLTYVNVGVVSSNGRGLGGDLDLEVVEAAGKYSRYHSVILTSDSLAYQSEPEEGGNWTSGLTYNQWLKLRRHCAQYGVRTLSLFTYPSQRYGVSHVTVDGAEEAKTVGHLWFMDKGPYTLTNIYRLPCQLDPGVMGVEPVVWLSNSGSRPPADSASVGGVKLAAIPGHQGEEIHFFFASSSGVAHGQPVGKQAAEWLTGNVKFNNGPTLSVGVIAAIVAAGLAVLLALAYVVVKLRHRCCSFHRRGKGDYVTQSSMLDWNNAQAGY